MSGIPGLKPRRALVAGAEGFLGTHLVRDLRQQGVFVTGLARRPRPGMPYLGMGDAPWSVARLIGIIEHTEPDVVFNLVGGAVGSRAELEQLNVGVTRTLMSALEEVQARPLLVCCGSAAEYGRAIVDGEPVSEAAPCAPSSAYGEFKLAQTQSVMAFAERSGTPALIVRIFNPIGPGMPQYLALADFARQIAMLGTSPGVLQTGDLQVSRDFLDVRHVATAFLKLSSNEYARGIVNICSGQATRLSRLVELLIEASGRSVTVETVSSRLRGDEARVVIGDPTRLASLGAAVPQTEFPALLAAIWQDAKRRWTGAS